MELELFADTAGTSKNKYHSWDDCTIEVMKI